MGVDCSLQALLEGRKLRLQVVGMLLQAGGKQLLVEGRLQVGQNILVVEGKHRLVGGSLLDLLASHQVAKHSLGRRKPEQHHILLPAMAETKC